MNGGGGALNHLPLLFCKSVHNILISSQFYQSGKGALTAGYITSLLYTSQQGASIQLYYVLQELITCFTLKKKQ